MVVVCDFDSPPTVALSFEESIKKTKLCLVASLNNIEDNNSTTGISVNSISDDLLIRPPFVFIHTLVKVYTTHLFFAKGLYDDTELITNNNIKNENSIAISLSKQEKIRFLVKILACVAAATDIRVDIYVSPARVISGRDVSATHLFLRCLATAACSCSIDASQRIASNIVRVGETILYRESVKTRNMITKMQAIIRGKRVRRCCLQSVDVDHRDKQVDQASDLVPLLQVGCSNESNYEDAKEINEDQIYEKMSKINCNLYQPASPDTSDHKAKKHCIKKTQPIKVVSKQYRKTTRDDDKNSGINVKDKIGSFSNPSSQPPSPAVTKATRLHSPKVIDSEYESSSSVDLLDHCKDCNIIILPSKNTEGRPETRVEVNTICLQNSMSKDKMVQLLCNSSTQTEISTHVRGRKRNIKKSDGKSLRDNVNVENCSVPVSQSIEQKKNRASSSTQVKALKTEMLANPVKETKCRIINGVMMREKVEKYDFRSAQPQSNVQTEQKYKEDDDKSVCDDTRRLQEKLKKHLMKVQKRESKLKHRLEDVRGKEEQLKTHEIRVAKLAEHFRRKQERLYQDGINQSLEMDKLRLQISEAARESHKYNEKSIKKGESRQEDQLKRVSDHPTITDLRIKLERKERALIRRGRKMRKIEKVLLTEREALNKIPKCRKDEQQFSVSSRSNRLIISPPLNPNISQMSDQVAAKKLLSDLSLGFSTSEGKGQEFLEKKEFMDISPNERAEDCNDVLRGQSVSESDEDGISTPNSPKVFIGNKTTSTAATPKYLVAMDLEESQKSLVKKRNLTLPRKRTDKSIDTHSNNLEEFPRRLASYSSHYKQLERQTYLIHPSQEI